MVGACRLVHFLLASHPETGPLRQVECGAEVIVTQPPLVWPLFEAWLDALNRYGRAVQGAPQLLCLSNLAQEALRLS